MELTLFLPSLLDYRCRLWSRRLEGRIGVEEVR